MSSVGFFFSSRLAAPSLVSISSSPLLYMSKPSQSCLSSASFASMPVKVPKFKLPTLTFTLLPFLLFWCLQTHLCHFLLLCLSPTLAGFLPAPVMGCWCLSRCRMEILFMILIFDLAKILHQMPFLMQHSPFIRAWNQHLESMNMAFSVKLLKKSIRLIRALWRPHQISLKLQKSSF